MKKLILGLSFILFGGESFSQNWTEIVKKLASDKAERDEFGYSVSISGTTAVVGAIGHNFDATGNNNKNNAGAAYILERDGSGNWNEVQKIVASDRASGDWFGWSIDISGTTIVVGASHKDEDTFSFAGAAYIFERNSSGVWNEVQKLVAYDKDAIDRFGYSVAISGNHIIIGAPEKEDTSMFWGLQAGAAYIFERNGSSGWTLTQKVLASDKAVADWFGSSVSISGATAIIGAPHKDNGGTVYVFERNGNGVWNETQKLISADIRTNDHFGNSVRISGATAIIGADGEDEDENGANTLNAAGSAYIFERNSNGVWNQAQKIVASDRGVGDQFGSSVTVLGTTAVVGTYLEDEDATGVNTLNKSGSAYIFERNSNGVWNQTQKIVASDRAEEDEFSKGGIAISGSTILVACPEKHYKGSSSLDYAGAVYFFETSTTNVNNINSNTIGLNIIPNPNNGKFIVKIPSTNNETAKIIVTDIFGRQVKETTAASNGETVIELDAPAGIYFVIVATAEGRYTEKLIIQ